MECPKGTIFAHVLGVIYQGRGVSCSHALQRQQPNFNRSVYSDFFGERVVSGQDCEACLPHLEQQYCCVLIVFEKTCFTTPCPLR